MSKRLGKRPIVLNNPKVVEDLESAVKSGVSLEAAAHYASIHPATLFRYMERGREERDSRENGNRPNKPAQVYLDVLETVERARAQAEVRNVAIINNAAANGTWQAAAWWLERTMPQKYGRRLQTEVSGPDGGAIDVSVSVDALEEKLAALMAPIIEAEAEEQDIVEGEVVE
jgi:hypothetical protein